MRKFLHCCHTFLQYQKIVFLVPKHAGLRRTLKSEFSINMEPLKYIYRGVQGAYVTYMIANDHFMIHEHFCATFSHFSRKFVIFWKNRSILEACIQTRAKYTPKFLRKILPSRTYLKVCKFSSPQKHISHALKIRLKILPNFSTT